MVGLMELVNSFEPQSKEHDAFLQDLLVYNNDLPFDSEEVNSLQTVIITTINSRINQENTRCAGLALLENILPRCSKEILIKYGILWISKATQVVENIHSSQRELATACKVLGSLIAQCKEVPELQKQMAMQCVKQLLNIIIDLDRNTKCGALYYLIATLLHYYPEMCERHQEAISSIALHQVDSAQANLVNSGAKCYTLLAKATQRSFKPPPSKSNYTSWIYNQTLICNSMHLIMDELFSDLVELQNVDIWCQLNLPELSDENIIEYYNKQKQRFANLCTYLSTMLRGYNLKNSTYPTDILQLLCRGLAITPANLKQHDTVKQRMLYLILPKLHIGLLNVLNALITGFGRELVPYGSTILQLFRQTLKWTEEAVNSQVTISESKPFRNVRISTYQCLTTWLSCNHSLSGIETIGDECLSGVLKDIIPKKDCVLLAVQKPQSRMSKRAMKRFKESQYTKSASLELRTGHQDVDLCKEALIVLQNIFFSAGTTFKLPFFKAVQNTIVPLLYDHYLNTSTQNFYKENVECRLHLLKALRAIEMNPHNQTPPPTQYSVQIFEMALNDDSVQIVQEAKSVLAELEKIVHPSAPTLQLNRVEELEATNNVSVNGNVSLNEELFTISDKRSGLKNKSAPDESEESSSKRQKVASVAEDVPSSIERNESNASLSELQIDEALNESNTISETENKTLEAEDVIVSTKQEANTSHFDISGNMSTADAVPDKIDTAPQETREESPVVVPITEERSNIVPENDEQYSENKAENSQSVIIPETVSAPTQKQDDTTEDKEEEVEMLLSFQDEPKE